MSERRRAMIAGAGGEAGDIVFAITVPDGGGTFNPNISQSGGYVAVTDWGDGTTDTGVRSHTYSAGGDYIVRYWRGTGGAFTSMSPVYGSGNSYITSLKKWANPDAITSCNRSFMGCSNMQNVPKDFKVDNATDCGYMFYGCSSLTSLPSTFAIPNATLVCGMFYGCSLLTSLPSTFSIPNATRVDGMFDRCSSLTSLPANFSVPNATNCGSMFWGCSSLTSLPANFYNTLWTGVSDTDINVSGMFRSCSNLDASAVPAEKFWEFPGANGNHLQYATNEFYGCKNTENVKSDWKSSAWGGSTLYQPEKEE